MTHFFVGALGTGTVHVRKLWFLSLFCSALPDIDGVITKLSARLLHLRLGGMWWDHRAFSHSLLFALIVGGLAAGFAQKIVRPDKPSWLLFLYFVALTASHGLIDAATNGGQGIMFFAPFYDGRYLFLFTPVPALRVRQWFGSQGLITFGKEILWIWLPLSITYAGLQLLRRRGKRPRSEVRCRRSERTEVRCRRSDVGNGKDS
jgi:inner membrane protein